jgi:EPS-associated MarR family transcriptional regulator
LQGGSVSKTRQFHEIHILKQPLFVMLTDEYRYKILKELEANPEISQRELAKALGISLGKVNFCIQALIEKGLIKARNFKNSHNKKAYIYLLTPKGIEDKASVTLQFLKIKMNEYQALKAEIEHLQQEAKQIGSVGPRTHH